MLSPILEKNGLFCLSAPDHGEPGSPRRAASRVAAAAGRRGGALPAPRCAAAARRCDGALPPRSWRRGCGRKARRRFHRSSRRGGGRKAAATRSPALLAALRRPEGSGAAPAPRGTLAAGRRRRHAPPRCMRRGGGRKRCSAPCSAAADGRLRRRASCGMASGAELLAARRQPEGGGAAPAPRSAATVGRQRQRAPLHCSRRGHSARRRPQGSGSAPAPCGTTAARRWQHAPRTARGALDAGWRQRRAPSHPSQRGNARKMAALLPLLAARQRPKGGVSALPCATHGAATTRGCGRKAVSLTHDHFVFSANEN